MNQNALEKINVLINNKQINEAQFELSKLGPEFLRNPEYLYLRSKVFSLNKLHYIAIDTLLISLEFDKSEKIYKLLGKIYNIIGNKELSKKILNIDSRFSAVNSLKNELSGIYRKNTD